MLKVGQKFVGLIGLVLTINFVFALWLSGWATDEDFSGVFGSPFERFTDFFYFGVTTFTTTGFGDIVPKSRRARYTAILYMVVVFSAVVTIITHYY